MHSAAATFRGLFLLVPQASSLHITVFGWSIWLLLYRRSCAHFVSLAASICSASLLNRTTGNPPRGLARLSRSPSPHAQLRTLPHFVHWRGPYLRLINWSGSSCPLSASQLVEITTIYPFRLYAGMKIGQIYFLTPEGDIQLSHLYNGKYQGAKGAVPSKINQDF